MLTFDLLEIQHGTDIVTSIRADHSEITATIKSISERNRDFSSNGRLDDESNIDLITDYYIPTQLDEISYKKEVRLHSLRSK